MLALFPHKGVDTHRRSGNSLVLPVLAWSLIVLTAAAVSGCGELEPIAEPEAIDSQLTIDTLKTQVRDTQRSLTELRIELESRRQELAEVQVARAQLEGRVREAERRLVEARQVVELQREELIAARAERERVFRSSVQLQNQLKQLQKQRAKPGRQTDGNQDVSPAPAGAAVRKGPRAIPLPSIHEAPAGRPRVPVTPAAMASDSGIGGQPIEQSVQTEPARQVTIKSGDTLWSIARRYRVSLQRLRMLNGLADDQIEVGQILQLP